MSLRINLKTGYLFRLEGGGNLESCLSTDAVGFGRVWEEVLPNALGDSSCVGALPGCRRRSLSVDLVASHVDPSSREQGVVICVGLQWRPLHEQRD